MILSWAARAPSPEGFLRGILPSPGRFVARVLRLLGRGVAYRAVRGSA